MNNSVKNSIGVIKLGMPNHKNDKGNMDNEFNNLAKTELLQVIHKLINVLCHNTQGLSKKSRESFISCKIEKLKKEICMFMDKQVDVYNDFYEDKND